MSIEWHTSNAPEKKQLALQNELFRTDVSSGDSDAVVFNTYSFNFGAAPKVADGITFKGYSIIGRDVELLGEASILFEQLGNLN